MNGQGKNGVINCAQHISITNHCVVNYILSPMINSIIIIISVQNMNVVFKITNKNWYFVIGWLLNCIKLCQNI